MKPALLSVTKNIWVVVQCIEMQKSVPPQAVLISLLIEPQLYFERLHRLGIFKY